MLNNFKIRAIVFVSAFLLLNAVNAFSQTANAKFLAARAFDGGVGFATGDFNGDGKLDVAAAGVDRLNLSFGNGDGKFNQPTTVFGCANFSSTAIKQPLVGDFNGDGKIDLASWIEDNSCSGIGSRVLMLLPGNGSGGFASPIFTTVSNFFFTPDQYLTADFNGDGRTDVALGSSFSVTDGDKVAIFLSSGSTGFAQPVIYNLGGQAFYTLTVGDFNNDSRADLIYALRSPTNLSLLPNNGDGTFGAPQVVSSGTFVGGIATGDFNNDGKLDFAASQDAEFNPTIRTWLGSGNNTFTAGASFNITINSGTRGFLSGDFNRDGFLDLALPLVSRTLILKGNGNGGFAVDEFYATGGGRLFKGDFNGDGWLDLGTTQTLGFQGSASGASSEFAVLLNLRNGKFLTAPAIDISFGGDEAVIADFNNDGLKDIALTGDAVEGEIALILQDANAAFDRPARRVKSESARRGAGIIPRTIAAGDFNADGKMDVVVAGRASAGITENVLIAGNNGAGDLTLLSTLSLGGTITKVLVGDFNGDNILDLAFSQNRETGAATIPALSVAFGTGGGAFAAPVGYLAGSVGISLAKADFNGDGKADLALARNDAKVSVLLNNGSGVFALNATYDLPAAPTEIAAADLHGDGKADLIVATNVGFISNSAKISVFAGNGNGTFAAPVSYPTVRLYDQRLAVDDFNGDGKLDVAVTNNGVITVLENDGSGALTGRNLWASTGALKDIVSGDLDGDGKPDLITTSGAQDFFSLSILLNISSPTVSRPTLFDFDGDNKADVSVFRPSNGTWYLQRSSAGFTGTAFGASTDKIVPADYDGDGKTDVAVYRSGVWYLQRSTLGFVGVSFGAADDIPVAADYDGDGKADIAVFRPSNGTWYLQRSTLGFVGAAFGQSGDIPVAADYDGDGKADIAVFRNGTWYLQRSQLGFTGIAFGAATDKPVAADYDGDGKTDVAVFRPSTGTWYLQQSTLGFTGVTFGFGTDKLVPADYDGDGRTDVAVFRDGNWYLQRSQLGFTGITFGAATDTPVPNVSVP